MINTDEHIYEYQFNSLYQCVKSIIGRDTINIYNTTEDEQDDKELDEILCKSNLLFDVSGNDFKWFKACESDYRYWVEVYILKMIENQLARTGFRFEENYHSGCNEKHSIVYESNGEKIEVYFLFDIEYEQPNCTDYDKLAEVLFHNAQNIDKIEIYIFRDSITQPTMAWLINNSPERNMNGRVRVFPLHLFFQKHFEADEYAIFCKYANDFHVKCNNTISYKTVITPTKRTITAFKQRKCQMLRDIDYFSIAGKGKSGYLSDKELAKVNHSFLSKKMYTAMVSSNDFADSFISAEWAYDVYSNSMGELDLTGIIAGYLKSIEQLMYRIAQFHKNKGIKIKTKNGYEAFTTNNEKTIDSTIGSLNNFIREGKLGLSKNIKGCIHKAVDLWRQDQRNGYFHKTNLYLSDNKLSEVRELTLFLYFLILGGISFSPQELSLLGVTDTSDKEHLPFNEKKEYPRFKEWFNNIITFDLPKEVPGIWILLKHDQNTWEADPYLMKYFYYEDYESGGCSFSPEQINLNHVHNIPPFSWESDVNN